MQHLDLETVFLKAPNTLIHSASVTVSVVNESGAFVYRTLFECKDEDILGKVYDFLDTKVLNVHCQKIDDVEQKFSKCGLLIVSITDLDNTDNLESTEDMKFVSIVLTA